MEISNVIDTSYEYCTHFDVDLSWKCNRAHLLPNKRYGSLIEGSDAQIYLVRAHDKTSNRPPTERVVQRAKFEGVQILVQKTRVSFANMSWICCGDLLSSRFRSTCWWRRWKIRCGLWEPRWLLWWVEWWPCLLMLLCVQIFLRCGENFCQNRFCWDQSCRRFYVSFLLRN